jgi:hypothetical protein
LWWSWIIAIIPKRKKENGGQDETREKKERREEREEKDREGTKERRNI